MHAECNFLVFRDRLSEMTAKIGQSPKKIVESAWIANRTSYHFRSPKKILRFVQGSMQVCSGEEHLKAAKNEQKAHVNEICRAVLEMFTRNMPQILVHGQTFIPLTVAFNHSSCCRPSESCYALTISRFPGT